jgi:hypothetical protein
VSAEANGATAAGVLGRPLAMRFCWLRVSSPPKLGRTPAEKGAIFISFRETIRHSHPYQSLCRYVTNSTSMRSIYGAARRIWTSMSEIWTSMQSMIAAMQSTTAAMRSTTAPMQSTTAAMQSTTAAMQSTTAAMQSMASTTPSSLRVPICLIGKRR